MGLTNIKITGEAVSEDEEAAATFPADLKKLIMVSYSPRFQAATGVLVTYPWQIRRETVFLVID